MPVIDYFETSLETQQLDFCMKSKFYYRNSSLYNKWLLLHIYAYSFTFISVYSCNAQSINRHPEKQKRNSISCVENLNLTF